jgi:DNA-binding NarL/FixJ family response regulator
LSYSVLVAESYRLLRQGICSMVERSGEFTVVAEAAEGKEAVNSAAKLHPDLAIIDLSLPGLSGIETSKEIRRRSPNTKIIAITGYEAKEYFLEVMKIGLDGFLLKEASIDELLRAMRTVALGQAYVCPEIAATFLHRTPRRNEPSALARFSFNDLTAREGSLFKLIAEGHTNRSAADYLSLSEKTIEKHRSSLMRKLNLRSAVDLKMHAIDIGLIQRDLQGNGELSALLSRPTERKDGTSLAS